MISTISRMAAGISVSHRTTRSAPTIHPGRGGGSDTVVTLSISKGAVA
jgi:hypothetical protein